MHAPRAQAPFRAARGVRWSRSGTTPAAGALVQALRVDAPGEVLLDVQGVPAGSSSSGWGSDAGSLRIPLRERVPSWWTRTARICPSSMGPPGGTLVEDQSVTTDRRPFAARRAPGGASAPHADVAYERIMGSRREPPMRCAAPAIGSIPGPTAVGRSSSPVPCRSCRGPDGLEPRRSRHPRRRCPTPRHGRDRWWR